MRTVKPIDLPNDPHISDLASLAQFIKAKRTQSGLRLEDVAGLLNISRQTMVNVEAGHPGVSIETVLRVASSVGLSLLAVPSTDLRRVTKLITDAGGEPACP